MFDIEEQLSFYGAYHHNKINQLIHIVCVPAIFFTALVFLTNLGVVGHWSLDEYFPLNPAFFVAAAYAVYYIALEPIAGSLEAPIIMYLCWLANQWHASKPDANMLAVQIHVAAWIAQFIGHGVFEGRAPALIDSFGQALGLAPLFVWLEVLFMCGYNKKLHDRINRKAVVDIQKWKATKKA
jgi:uncharacterized membrane protein YGL010W